MNAFLLCFYHFCPFSIRLLFRTGWHLQLAHSGWAATEYSLHCFTNMHSFHSLSLLWAWLIFVLFRGASLWPQLFLVLLAYHRSACCTFCFPYPQQFDRVVLAFLFFLGTLATVLFCSLCCAFVCLSFLWIMLKMASSTVSLGIVFSCLLFLLFTVCEYANELKSIWWQLS